MADKETLINPKIIDAVAGTFPDMDNTDRISSWAKENPQRVMEVTNAYFDLLDDINHLNTDDEKLRELVPGAVEMKEACDKAGVSLPKLEDFDGFSGLLTFFKGLRDAKPAINAGQEIKRDKLEASPVNIKFAVGTTSLDLDNDTLGPPILGHLLERAVYRYLSEQGVELPENPKDSILHPQSDVLKLRYAKGEESPLVKVYTQPGLNWSSKEKFDAFRERYNQIYKES